MWKERYLYRATRCPQMQVCSTIYWESVHRRLWSGVRCESRLRQSSRLLQSTLQGSLSRCLWFQCKMWSNRSRAGLLLFAWLYWGSVRFLQSREIWSVLVIIIGWVSIISRIYPRLKFKIESCSTPSSESLHAITLRTTQHLSHDERSCSLFV